MADERLREYFKPALGFGSPPLGETLQENSEDETLTDKQIDIVIMRTGMDLARLHRNTGKGFGWIDPLKAAITRRFSAEHESWHDFLTDFFDGQTEALQKVMDEERENGQYHTELSIEHREKFDYLHSQRPVVRKILEKREMLLTKVIPHLLHGNVYIGDIHVEDGNYSGLGDYSQMLLGDPIDDLAYFSVMPQGDKLVGKLIEGWEAINGVIDIEEKMHLYRLWEACRKIGSRYVKHRYLDEYPEPLDIALKELGNFK